MPLFFLLAISIVTGLHGYVWLRLCSDTALPAPLFWTGSALVVALYLLLLASFFAYRMLPTGSARWLKFPVYLWMGFAFYLSVGFALVDLSRLALHLVRALGLIGANPLASISGARVAALSVLGIGTLIVLYGMFEALLPGRVRLRRLTLELPRLRGGADGESGFRIVQLSDLHIGPTLRERWLRAIVARVNALEPDLIVLTGDIVDGQVAHVARFAAGFAELRAEHGVYFCTGNHDVYSGIEAWSEELARLGLHPLRNERVAIGEPPLFDLAGVDDFAARHRSEGGGPDFERALGGRDESRAVVLLAHQPPAISAAVAHGVDLQLSGHTHGGQLWPFHVFTRLQTAYRAGLYRVADSWLYVSRGTGFWGPPLRVFAPAEITELTLRPPR